MSGQERLPLDEQVDEVKAKGEDRLADIVVPALENFAALLSRQANAVQQRLRSLRRQA